MKNEIKEEGNLNERIAIAKKADIYIRKYDIKHDKVSYRPLISLFYVLFNNPIYGTMQIIAPSNYSAGDKRIYNLEFGFRGRFALDSQVLFIITGDIKNQAFNPSV
jgi:glycosyltransferase involved in cell wall biosynthesis